MEQVHDTVGYPSIGASDDGGDTVGGQYTPTNLHDYPSKYFPPSAEVDPSSEIAVETTMNMLPGSTVPARATEVEETFTIMKFLPGSTVPAIMTETMETVDIMKIMPGSTVPARTVEAMQTADLMNMLSAATVPAITAHVATNKTHKVGNLPKKPAPKRSWAAKGGPKYGTEGGRK